MSLCAFNEEQLCYMEGILSTCSKYDGSHLVDFANRFSLPFWDPLVFTLSTGDT